MSFHDYYIVLLKPMFLCIAFFWQTVQGIVQNFVWNDKIEKNIALQILIFLSGMCCSVAAIKVVCASD